jgi:hypothetical protein
MSARNVVGVLVLLLQWFDSHSETVVAGAK